MSLLNKTHIMTRKNGDTRVIHDMRSFIREIGLRNFALEGGLYFDEHLPSLYQNTYGRMGYRSNYVDDMRLGKFFSSAFVLEDFFTGSAVDPIDIAYEFLNEFPEYGDLKIRRFHCGGGVRCKRNHRRKYQRHVKMGIHSRLLDRDRAKEFGFNMPSFLDAGGWYDDYMPLEEKNKNWKRFRKTQHK